MAATPASQPTIIPRRWFPRFTPRTVLVLPILCLTYIVVSRLGLTAAPLGNFAAFIWPSTGISIAALILGGVELWPAIFVGAFITNWWVGAPLWVAFLIGTGNTLEAVVAAYLLRRVIHFDPQFTRSFDIFGYILFAAFVGPFISATVGVSTIYVAHIISAALYTPAWVTWFLGDVLGALIVGPLILVFAKSPPTLIPRAMNGIWLIERALFLVILISVGLLVFTDILPIPIKDGPVSYLIFIPLLWATFRFGKRAAIVSAFVTSVIAIMATFVGTGPFVIYGHSIQFSLLLLQIFLITITSVLLILSTVVIERRQIAEELQLADETKNNFLATLSHELRNPLAPIVSAVELLRLQTGQTKSTEELVTIIDRQVLNMRVLLDDLLDLSRVTRGKVVLDQKTIDFRDVVKKSVETATPFINSRAHRLSVMLPDTPLMISGDSLRLEQVVINLLNNAAKYTNTGGHIELRLRQEDDEAVLDVSDNGIGISREHLTKIFEPFSQVAPMQEPSVRDGHGGLGIGLYVVRNLIMLHGGSVSAWSMGKLRGSVFTVRLPIYDENNLPMPADN